MTLILDQSWLKGAWRKFLVFLDPTISVQPDTLDTTFVADCGGCTGFRGLERLATRASIVLLAAEGKSNNAIANQLGTTPVSVIEWRRRFAAEGLDSLGKVRPGRGRPRQLTDNKVTEVIHLTLNTQPEGATHWSCRQMAKQVGLSPATVQWIWHEHRIYPHKVRTFKVSKDPDFLTKLTDVVGLYLNPPRSSGRALPRSEVDDPGS